MTYKSKNDYLDHTEGELNLFVFRAQLDRVLYPVVSTVAKLPLHANDWTVLGACVGLVCAVFLISQEPAC